MTADDTPHGETAETHHRGDVSRAAILDAANTLFAATGSRGTSLASIAEIAGLSQPGLLHHFPSKNRLLLAVLDDRDSEDGRLSASHLTENGIGILQALGALVAHNQASPQGIRLYSVLLGESLAADHPAHDYFVERYRKIRDRIQRNLALAEKAGDVQPGHDLAAISALIVAVLDGLQYQWLLDPDIDMVANYRVMCEAMVAFLGAPPSAPQGQGVATATDLD